MAKFHVGRLWSIATRCSIGRIGEDTVKHHLTSVFDKTGASNRVELALVAIHHRLVAIPLDRVEETIWRENVDLLHQRNAGECTPRPRGCRPTLTEYRRALNGI